MKVNIKTVKIALHFREMNVMQLVNFAGSIKDNATADPEVIINPLDLTQLGKQTTLLYKTVVKRKTNLSKSLTTKQTMQASKLMITVYKISNSVEMQANDIMPGNVTRAKLAIQRIGFKIIKDTPKKRRSFEVFKTSKSRASVRVKGNEDVNLFHWRWSPDGKTWIRLPDSKGASIIIFGLPKGLAHFQSAQTMKVKGIPLMHAYKNKPYWSDSITATIP